MNAKQLIEWESAARETAERLCGMILATVSDDLSLNNVAVDVADATNSLDADFIARLDRREHLTDDFLAHA